jgi:uncharacterized ubiquitin-like protein YukD
MAFNYNSYEIDLHLNDLINTKNLITIILKPKNLRQF